MKPVIRMFGATFAASALVCACATAPETRAERADLEAQADATLSAMLNQDPTLRDVIEDAPAYVVFPSVGEGAAVVGAASGVGVVYDNGRPIGYAELSKGSIGPQLGGKSFSELVVLESPEALERLRGGKLDLTADASATAVDAGAGASATFQDGTAVFVDLESGMMAGVSVGGQSLRYFPEYEQDDD